MHDWISDLLWTSESYTPVVVFTIVILSVSHIVCWVCIEKIMSFQFTGLYTKEPHQRSCTHRHPFITEPDLDNEILDFELIT